MANPKSSQKSFTYACDICRRKKRKCTWSENASKCDPCMRNVSECQISYEPKPRAKRQERPSRKELTILSSRIQQLEALLAANSKQLPEGESAAPEIPVAASESEIQAGDFDYEETQENSDFSGETLNWTAAEDYFNPGSELIPTQVPARPPVTEPQLIWQPAENVPTVNHPVPSPWINPGSTSGFPPSKEVHLLLKEYLVDFNQAIPLVSPETLVSSFRVVYTQGIMSDKLHQANVWAFLAIAHRLRAMSPFKSGQDDARAKAYLHQAFTLLSDLLMSTPSLLTLQCIVGMSIVIEGIAEQEAAFSLLAAAFRISETIWPAIRRAGPASDEFERFKRVYWTAFSVDSDLCIRRRRPPVHSTYSVSIPLPQEQLCDGHGVIRLDSYGMSLRVFSLTLKLAQIQSQVLRKWLFPMSQQSVSEKAAWKQRLLAELASWREDLFFQFDPELLIKELHRSDAVHVRVLEKGYFNTVVALCQGDEVYQESLNSRVLYKVSTQETAYCLEDARRLLKMLVFFPEGEHAVLWLLFEALCSAAYVLLKNIIDGVESAAESRDIQLGTHVIELVRELEKNYPGDMIGAVLKDLEDTLQFAQFVQVHKNSQVTTVAPL